MAFKKESISLLYAATSANLVNFLNHTDVAQHYRLFNEIVGMAYKAHRDLMTFAVDDLILEDPYNTMGMVEKKQPPIFVSFYTGSYNMLIASLLKSGANLHALSDTESAKIADFQNLPGLYSERYRNNCNFFQINAEQDGSIFKTLKAIRQGFPMLGFLDGNKGIGGLAKDNNNLMEIDFLKGRIKVRKGISIIAYLAKRPIVVALSYLKDNQTHLLLHKPIEVDTDNKKEFVQTSMKAIFTYFEAHLIKYYSQWCSWPYVHNWSDLSVFKKKTETKSFESGKSRVQFNDQRFCPIKYLQHYYLFDRYGYSLSAIDPMYNALLSGKTSNSKREILIEHLFVKHPERFAELLNKQILIRA